MSTREIYFLFRCIGCYRATSVGLMDIPRDAEGAPVRELRMECYECVMRGNVASIRILQTHTRIGTARDAGGREYELLVL